MSPLRRDDPGPRRERTAEERERDRREREARRLGLSSPDDVPARDAPPGLGATPPGPPPPPEPGVSPVAPPLEPPEPPAAEPPPAVEPVAPAPPHDPPPYASPPAAAPPPYVPPSPEPPPPYADPDPPTDVQSRGWRSGPGERKKAVRRIQPEPPAPPAAPAGALSEEPERPLGVRLARRIAHPSRAVVTPPADVPRGPVRARRSVGKRIFAILVLLVAAALIFGIVKVFEPFAGDPGAPVSVEIPPGSSVSEIGDRLAAAKVVGSGTIFELRATLAGKRGDLQSGTYEMRRDMTYGAAITALSKVSSGSGDKTTDVTIPEGRSRREIVQIVQTAGLKGNYLTASERFSGKLNPFRYDAPKGTRALEGFLYPSTYELGAGATARDLVERQLTAFKENFGKVNLRRAHRRKLTAYDVLIIASMIEREAGVARDRRLIAAVIYNRLRDGMRLGIDATIRYALRKPSGALTKTDLAIESPYNLGKRAGLPPTPIGNPGLASIRAAANPARVSYRYFVVKPGTCSHAFSTTPAQFQRDSDRYDAARQKAGKSPTTC